MFLTGLIAQRQYPAAGGGGGGNPGENAVYFDGTNDALTRAALSTATDSGTMTTSFWIKPDTQYGGIFCFLESGSYKIRINVNSGTTMYFTGRNSAGAMLMNIYGACLTANVWQHVIFSITTGGSWHLYVDDVDKSSGMTVTANTSGNLWFEANEFQVGRYAATSYLKGCLSEVYFNTDEYIDLSSSTNRRKFIDASGDPVDLGTDGSTPTGNQPALYLNGSNSNFETNQGYGGNLSVTGSLDNCTDAPV